jgi:hypothetical protein
MIYVHLILEKKKEIQKMMVGVFCKLAARDGWLLVAEGGAEKASHQKRERVDQPQPGLKSQLTGWVGLVLSIADG